MTFENLLFVSSAAMLIFANIGLWSTLQWLDRRVGRRRRHGRYTELVEAVTALRQHVKALKEIPPLKLGEVPPWHLLEEARALNKRVDAALLEVG